MVSTDFLTIGEGDPGVGGTYDSSGNIDYNGGCTERFGVTAATANTAFAAAIAALPATGGVIKCYGGASPWTISATVTITKPNVTIDFGLTEMRPGAALASAFEIRARGFRARQPYINTTTISAADHAFFYFNDNSVEYGTNEGQVTDGLFIIGTTGASHTQKINAIRVAGQSATNLTRGFSFQRNCFVGSSSATQASTNEDGGGVPYGFTPIRLSNVTQSDIAYNAFYGQCTAGVNPVGNRMGYGIFLEDCILVPIIGNKFADYTTLTAAANKGACIYAASSSNEGHHNAIVGNVEEVAIVDYAIKLKTPNHQLIAANNLGRNSSALGAIYCLNGQDVTVVGNNIHNAGGTAPIVVEGTRNVNVKGNSFALLATGVPPYTTSSSGTVDFDETNVTIHQIQ